MPPVAARPLAPESVHRLRAEEFSDLGDTAYLNAASIGPLPSRTRRVVDAFTRKRAAPHRFDDVELLEVLRAARRAAAGLINADPDEIALATNTSFGLQQAALTLPLRHGDAVLVPDGEFPANVYPWLRLRERGVQVEIVPRTAEGWPDETRLLERLADPRVRALAVSFVQFSDGYRVDLDRLSRACRSHQVFLVVDAIQGLGCVPLDVRETPVDILSCGAQKWLLSPWGAGFCYVRRPLVSELRPATAGWMAFAGTEDFTRLTDYDDRYLPDARRFEMVTLPFQDLAGMTASLGLIQELEPARILEHVRRLREPVIEAAGRGAFGLASCLEPPHDSGILGLRPPRPEEAFRRLRAAGVTAALREGIVRLSPHAFTTDDDIGRALDALTATA